MGWLDAWRARSATPEKPPLRVPTLEQLAGDQASNVVFRGTSPSEALSHLRDAETPWTDEERAAALETAIVRLEKYRERERRRRADWVQRAREQKLLDGVVTLLLADRRHPQANTIGPLDIPGELGRRSDDPEVADAIRRARSLIAEGSTFDIESRPQTVKRRLRRRHPGFDDASLSAVISWGSFLQR